MTSSSVESYPGHTGGLKRVFDDIARVELGDGLTSQEPHIVRYFSTNDVERFRHTRFTSGSKALGVRVAHAHGFGPCGQRHQDIQSRTNAAVHQDLDVRTLEG